MTITTTTTPPEEQPETTPAPVEPPSVPAPEPPEPPVSREATQPADAVTAEPQSPSAQVTPIERYGGPMIVTAKPLPSVSELQRELEKSERARAQLASNVKVWARKAVALQARRDRLIRRALDYKTARDTFRQLAAAQPLPALPESELEKRVKKLESLLHTERQLVDDLRKDLARAEDAAAKTATPGGQIHGHDAAYWYRAWSRMHAIATGYKTAGDTEAFLAGVVTETAGAQ